MHQSDQSEENSKTLSFTLDPQGRILNANSMADELWGKTQGAYFLETICNNDSEVAHGIQKVWKTGKSWQGVFFPFDQDGVDIFLFPFEKGKIKVEISPQGYFTPASFSSEPRDNLSPLIQEKIKFLLRASHNLRAPLASIKSGLDFLQSEDISAENKKLVKNLISEVNFFAPLLEKILWMSRIDVGVPLSIEPINLGEFIDNFLQKFNRENLCEICYKKPKNKIMVSGERSALIEILQNLLNNSLKFCPEREISVLITDHDDHVVVLVKDCGVGIDPAIRERIFERFYSKKDECNPKGTGLGLSIAKELTELQGGKIGLGKPKTGTEVFFTLRKLSQK